MWVDFNVIGFHIELMRGGRVSSSMGTFLEVMEDFGFRDIPLQESDKKKKKNPLQEGPFTWRGG